MWSTLRSVVFFPLVLAALTTLGLLVNQLVPWSHLTDFFSVIKRFATVFSFTWDVTTLWTLVGLRLAFESAYWIWKGTLVVITFFVNN